MSEGPAFDHFAAEYTFWTQTLGARRFDDIVGWAADHADVALDAGCGDGFATARLAQRTGHAVGVDISTEMIALAKKRMDNPEGGEHLHFAVASGEHLPFREGAFDAVMSCHVLHFTNLEASVPELRRVLVPGGRLAIRDPVTSIPRLHSWPPWRLLTTLRYAPGRAMRYGVRAAWRVVRFTLSPEWTRRVGGNVVPTPERLREAYARLLPGCTLRMGRRGMDTRWEAAP